MEFKANLRNVVNDATDLLLTHREILEELVDSGYLKFFKPLGWISMDMLFCTIGVIGLYEALSLFGDDYVLPAQKGVSTARDILQYIDSLANKRTEETGIPFNVEQVPAESAAVTLAKADRIHYPKSPFDLYSNQSIPLWVDTDLMTRARVDGDLNHCYSGGGISHLNIGSPVTAEQHHRLIEFGISCGLDHFAINPVFSRCENNHVTFGKARRCGTCNGRIVERRTRVVGYFTPVEDWNEVRRKREFPKRVFGEVPFKDEDKDDVSQSEPAREPAEVSA
jgi:ribonucleoside-triphosphate reductase